MTAQNIIDEARLLLNDANATRWSNATLLIYIKDFLDELWTVRRSAFYTSAIVTTQPTQPTVVGSTVSIDNSYRMAGAHYLCYLAFLEDTDDTGNAKKAAEHRALYEKAVG